MTGQIADVDTAHPLQHIETQVNMGHWNYRLVEHRNSGAPDAQLYCTVHTIHYDDDGCAQAWASSPASPRDKEEADGIRQAFDEPIVLWVDDASFGRDELGFDDYKAWGWMPGIRYASEIEFGA